MSCKFERGFEVAIGFKDALVNECKREGITLVEGGDQFIEPDFRRCEFPILNILKRESDNDSRCRFGAFVFINEFFELETEFLVQFSNIFRLDNIQVDATVIPEPSAALFSLFGLGLLARRRR